VPRRVRISAGSIELTASLAETHTADAIWQALPIDGAAQRWGDEIYFSIPVELESEPDARDDVGVGDLGYWPPGSALCIFWGRTPASHASEPRAASPVNVFGHVETDAARLAGVKSGERVRVEQEPER
jgi:uncharacterized protein